MPARPPSPPRRPGVRPPAQPPVRGAARPGAARAAPPRAQPLSEREIDELQLLLDGVPAPLEPLDVVMLDGYLCGVLVQPEPVPAERWLRHVTDIDGRALPPRFDAARLHALVLRRHAELDQAIAARRWFDPWVFELEGDEEEAHGAGVADTQRDGDADQRDTDARQPDVTEAGQRDPGEAHPPGPDEAGQRDADEADSLHPDDLGAVYPWVAGCATALEVFPALMRLPDDALIEPLALLYRHLAPEDLEDAESLLAAIDALEPLADLGEAVEGLVRAVLLLADVGRPVRTTTPGR